MDAFDIYTMKPSELDQEELSSLQREGLITTNEDGTHQMTEKGIQENKLRAAVFNESLSPYRY